MGARHSSKSDPIGILIGIILFLFIIIVSSYYDNKRKNKIKNYCSKNRIAYLDGSSYIPECEEIFDITSRGHRQYFGAIMYGERNGIVFSILDYFYHTGGKNGGHNCTICVLSKEGINFPKFYARTENPIFDWIGEKFGGQDIDFVEDFSRKFVLQGPNEVNIRKFFNSKIRSAFVKIHGNNYEFEASGNFFLVCRTEYLNIEERLKMLSDVMSLYLAIVRSIEKNNTSENSTFEYL